MTPLSQKGGADKTTLSLNLTENVPRKPMHRLDQLEAFRVIVDADATAAIVTTRFSVTKLLARLGEKRQPDTLHCKLRSIAERVTCPLYSLNAPKGA